MIALAFLILANCEQQDHSTETNLADQSLHPHPSFLKPHPSRAQRATCAASTLRQSVSSSFACFADVHLMVTSAPRITSLFCSSFVSDIPTQAPKSFRKTPMHAEKRGNGASFVPIGWRRRRKSRRRRKRVGEILCHVHLCFGAEGLNSSMARTAPHPEWVEGEISKKSLTVTVHGTTNGAFRIDVTVNVDRQPGTTVCRSVPG